MKSARAPRRYAKALFDLARESGVAALIGTDLREVCRCLKESADFSAFVRNPVLGRRKRVEVLSALLEARVQPMTWRFIVFVESKRRLPLLEEMCECYEALEEQAQGLLRVGARVAVPVDGGLQSLLGESIGRKLAGPVKLTLEYSPSLVGGFAFQAKDVVYDFSVACALRTVRERWRAGNPPKEK